MPASDNVNMRIPADILARIDANATAANISRTQYILSWLPENYTSITETTPDQADSNDR